MLRLVKLELYKTFLSRTMLVVMALLFIMGFVINSINTGIGRDGKPQEVYEISKEKADASSEITDFFDFITAEIGSAAYYEFDDMYAFAADIVNLRDFGPWGPVVYDRYHDSVIFDEFELKMGYPGVRTYDPAVTGVEEYTAYLNLSNMFTDNAYIVFFGVIFSVFFFGKDFSDRTYNGMLYSGISKIRIYASKLCSFYIVALPLSLLGLLLPMLVFVKGLGQIPSGYIIRCTLVWLGVSVGATAVFSIFPFIFKDVLKSTICCIFVMLILAFAVKGAALEYTPFSYASHLWETSVQAGAIFTRLMVSLASLVACGCVSCLLFKRAELK